MKKSDFKIPCSWESRRPVYLDRLLFIPEYFEGHEKFCQKKYFDNENEVIVEYCSGNGDWIIEKAKQNPHINWIAVEKRFDRARKIWLKMQNNNLKNLFVVFGEGGIFSKYYLQESFVDSIYINFPDPWPKKKHIKNRIVNDQFLKELLRILKKEGKAIIVTDDDNYSQEIISHFLSNDKYLPAFEKPYFINSWPDFGSSFFDNLWRSKGLSIKYIQFIKR